MRALWFLGFRSLMLPFSVWWFGGSGSRLRALLSFKVEPVFAVSSHVLFH